MTESPHGRLGKRLRRILVMLPYVIGNPGVTVDELAAKFGVARSELLRDLQLVWVCGLPGYSPDRLIEVTIDGDRVFVDMADYFKEPLRLTAAEALALYVSGATAATLPGMEEADALRRALDKVGLAIGADAGPGGIDVQMESPAAHLETLQRALSEHRRVALEYLSASRGELSEREVDPWGLLAALGHWYLVGWDHLRDEERMFRTDRIKSVALLDETAEVPSDFDPEHYRGAFSGRGGDLLSMEISPGVARWFEDYYPVRAAGDLPDGWRRVELLMGGLRFAATLVVRLGREVRNVSPEEVRAEARALAAGIAARYGT